MLYTARFTHTPAVPLRYSPQEMHAAELRVQGMAMDAELQTSHRENKRQDLMLRRERAQAVREAARERVAASCERAVSAQLALAQQVCVHSAVVEQCLSRCPVRLYGIHTLPPCFCSAAVLLLSACTTHDMRIIHRDTRAFLTQQTREEAERGKEVRQQTDDRFLQAARSTRAATHALRVKMRAASLDVQKRNRRQAGE